ncbi:MetQ/NlpA family ABC transporter substrate-binding protein [Variovorax sp. NFACC27]|uniref:MetQ/NlpA family ABC transporter substrate-binding protein n=1 Tax=unclassified Variovorax TaxID=663243 RepID=UPI000898638D|nr:D-methionine transport system substrate-binding protein [Variovorax paradoxus]SEF30391.1 D-methionine transport system substrate-binding protein [Variovorax sp. NFACC28]SEG86794.1 D-methionine transport system substrate-binding protein [Variovorax sp. NFACC29]SFD30900.1 D-methionine transport system substrate-binding protein [Variovorax sp. NFACC26]SFG32226.1 D-methionine transport system substrate-binding protein [Variovorax sp. NFACC27]
MKTVFLRRSVLALSLAALSLGGLSLQAHAQDPAKKNLVIGGTAGSNTDQLKAGIVPILEKKGYKVKLVEFNDYVQPNLALAQGSLDANFFQHQVYLKKFAADQKLDLAELVQGPIAPMGVYSTKRKTLADVKEGDRVTLPNDPSNLARALVLLEQNKLITIKSGIDPLRASEKDVAENPKKLKFIPLEAAQLPRSLGDTEYAIVNGNFAISSGLKLTEAVVLEKTPDYYLNVVAVKTADKNTQWAKDIAEAYRSKEFKAVVDSKFQGYAKPSFLQ